MGESEISNLWYVNAHATSTPRGDAAETLAVQRLLLEQDLGPDGQDHPPFPFLSSHKGSIGHLLGAAGSVESIFALLSLQSGVLAPNANLEQIGPDIQDQCVRLVLGAASTSQAPDDSLRKDLVLKNSFGFGGTNVSLLFKRFRQ